MEGNMENECGIVTECSRCRRVLKLKLVGYDKVTAIMLAGIMDGTSPIFTYPPKPDRSDVLPGNMGRCAACDGVFTCSVFGFADEAVA
jgi:hypothetical protein